MYYEIYIHIYIILSASTSFFKVGIQHEELVFVLPSSGIFHYTSQKKKPKTLQVPYMLDKQDASQEVLEKLMGKVQFIRSYWKEFPIMRFLLKKSLG